MNLPSHVAGLLTGLTRAMIEAMPPTHRQRLAAECERVGRMAAGEPSSAPKEGVLRRLADGERPP